MISRMYSASYERARRLIAAGCPIDDLRSLPRKSTAFRKTVQIEQIGGYVESWVMALGQFQMAYLIGVRLQTDLSQGVVIADWGFRPPWEDTFITWDCDPRQFVPASEHPWHESFFDSRLPAVINERRLLRRGYPVEGFLCGCAFRSIPESSFHGAPVYGELILTMDTGHIVARRIPLSVRRDAARTHKAHTTRREGRLFERPDFTDRKSEVREEQ